MEKFVKLLTDSGYLDYSSNRAMVFRDASSTWQIIIAGDVCGLILNREAFTETMRELYQINELIVPSVEEFLSSPMVPRHIKRFMIYNLDLFEELHGI